MKMDVSKFYDYKPVITFVNYIRLSYMTFPKW